MKLLSIFMAFPVFGKISQLKMNPKTAYRILKYTRTLGQEYDIIEKQRVSIIHELTNTKDGENASIVPGTSEHELYISRFGSILDVESDIQTFGCSMDEFLDKISDDKASDLTAIEISSIEPFFV
jgi:hypothetical protein